MTIPFTFIPIPRYFFENGWFKPKKNGSHLKDLLLISWTFSNTKPYFRNKIYDGDLIRLAPFEFVFGIGTVAKETGLTDKEVRRRVEIWESQAHLLETPNTKKNRYSCYQWNIPILSSSREETDEGQTEGVCPQSKEGQTQIRPKPPPEHENHNTEGIPEGRLRGRLRGRPIYKEAKKREIEKAPRGGGIAPAWLDHDPDSPEAVELKLEVKKLALDLPPSEIDKWIRYHGLPYTRSTICKCILERKLADKDRHVNYVQTALSTNIFGILK